MKRKSLVAAVLAVFAMTQINAQSIKVVYESQRKMDLKIDGVDQSIVEMIKKNSKLQYELCYSNGESVYKTLKSDTQSSSENSYVNIKTSEDITYRNHNTNREVSSKDFMGKQFLIETELKAGNWTVTDSTKTILGYLCKKAVLQTADGKEMSVWFCPNMPIKDGAIYTGLEGLVLEVQQENVNIVATEITYDSDCKIEVPTKGKKTSNEEFKEMVEKRMKAMGMENSGDGKIKITITR